MHQLKGWALGAALVLVVLGCSTEEATTSTSPRSGGTRTVVESAHPAQTAAEPPHTAPSPPSADALTSPTALTAPVQEDSSSTESIVALPQATVVTRVARKETPRPTPGTGTVAPNDEETTVALSVVQDAPSRDPNVTGPANDLLRQYMESGTHATPPPDATPEPSPTGPTPTPTRIPRRTPVPTTTRTPLPSPRPTLTPLPTPEASPSPDPGDASLYFDRTSLEVQVGERFSVTLLIDATGEAIASYMTSILFDPFAVHMDRVRSGSDPLLGRPVLVHSEMDGENQLGVLYISSVQGQDKTRPIGFGISLAEIEFTAREPGTTLLSISNSDVISVVGPFKVITGEGSCRVVVKPPPPPP